MNRWGESTLESYIANTLGTFVQELSQFERLIFSVAVVSVGVCLIVWSRKVNEVKIAAKAARKQADSAKPCDRCGRDKKPGLLLLPPYCHFCRVTFLKRTFVAATIGALTGTSVAFLLHVFSYVGDDFNWSDEALTSWLLCLPFYPVAAAMSPSRHPQVVWMLLIFTFPTLFMSWAPEDGEPWVWHGDLLASIACSLSICLALFTYWMRRRHECRSCGQRAALKQTERRHIPQDIFEAGHDEALWRCQYCSQEFWRAVMSSYEGGGG